jgi:hypothetical protein
MVPADSRRISRAPRYSGYRYAGLCLRVRDCHPLWLNVPGHSPRHLPCNDAVLLPRGGLATATVWALPRSLATTGGIINLFSLPAGTKMFQFPALASTLEVDDRASHGRVVPFGDPRIKGYLHLPADYRSLSRPSSPERAKASAMRPFLLS